MTTTGPIFIGPVFNSGLSPVEVGPALRLATKDQPMNDFFYVAMGPLVGFDSLLRVFNIERNKDGRWLVADFGRPDDRWPPEDSFVFARRKP